MSPNSQRVVLRVAVLLQIKARKKKNNSRAGRGWGGEGPQLSKQTNSGKETLSIHLSFPPPGRNRNRTWRLCSQLFTHLANGPMRGAEKKMGINKSKMGLCLPSRPGSVPSRCRLCGPFCGKQKADGSQAEGDRWPGKHWHFPVV